MRTAKVCPASPNETTMSTREKKIATNDDSEMEAGPIAIEKPSRTADSTVSLLRVSIFQPRASSAGQPTRIEGCGSNSLRRVPEATCGAPPDRAQRRARSDRSEHGLGGRGGAKRRTWGAPLASATLSFLALLLSGTAGASSLFSPLLPLPLASPHLHAERSIDVPKGSAQTVTIAMVAIPASAPSVTATASATPTVEVPQRSMVPAVLLGGAAVIAAGVGIGLDVDAASRDAEAKQTSQDILAAKHSCVAGAANFDARCGALAANAQDAQVQSLVGVGVLAGAGVLAAGALLYWFFPRGAPAKVSLSVTPSTSQPAGAIAVSGRF